MTVKFELAISRPAETLITTVNGLLQAGTNPTPSAHDFTSPARLRDPEFKQPFGSVRRDAPSTNFSRNSFSS